jgi:alcohol dehydrogenase (cytochrome c)
MAIDAKNGKPIWSKAVVDPALGYAFTLAPLVVKDKVIVGPAGGEYGIRGCGRMPPAPRGRPAAARSG